MCVSQKPQVSPFMDAVLTRGLLAMVSSAEAAFYSCSPAVAAKLEKVKKPTLQPWERGYSTTPPHRTSAYVPLWSAHIRTLRVRCTLACKSSRLRSQSRHYTVHNALINRLCYKFEEGKNSWKLNAKSRKKDQPVWLENIERFSIGPFCLTDQLEWFIRPPIGTTIGFFQLGHTNKDHWIAWVCSRSYAYQVWCRAQLNCVNKWIFVYPCPGIWQTDVKRSSVTKTSLLLPFSRRIPSVRFVRTAVFEKADRIP